MDVFEYFGMIFGLFVLIAIIFYCCRAMHVYKRRTDPQYRGAVVVIAGANGANQQNLHTTEPYPTQLYVVGLSAPPGYTPYDNSSNNLSNDLPPPYSVAVSQQVATTTVHQTNVAK